MSEITEITRRNILDTLSVEKTNWAGRLSEIQFLSRIYDLHELTSTDFRYSHAENDISQHRISFLDWPDDWVFHDSRFQLLDGPDETFLKFLCEMVHPVVRPDRDEAKKLVDIFNAHLAADKWEIVPITRISGTAVFGARRRIASTVPSATTAKEIAATLNASYIGQQTTRMEAAIDDDPELAIGTAKEFVETICKTILAEKQEPYAADETTPALVKKTITKVTLVETEITNHEKAAATVGNLLKNLAAVAHQLAELRNPYGTGHGKEATHKGLQRHHARLAVSAATAIAVFLYEIVESEKHGGTN